MSSELILTVNIFLITIILCPLNYGRLANWSFNCSVGTSFQSGQFAKQLKLAPTTVYTIVSASSAHRAIVQKDLSNATLEFYGLQELTMLW